MNGKPNDGGPTAYVAKLVQTGVIYESLGLFEVAVGAYQEAIRHNPKSATMQYWARNNLAFSLNMLGRFDEAVPLCIAAINIAPDRYNAYKNLGVALEGQGRLVEAASNYCNAAVADPRDGRALALLGRLLERQPEIGRGHPEIAAAVESARKAATSEDAVLLRSPATGEWKLVWRWTR